MAKQVKLKELVHKAKLKPEVGLGKLLEAKEFTLLRDETLLNMENKLEPSCLRIELLAKSQMLGQYFLPDNLFEGPKGARLPSFLIFGAPL